MATTWKKKADEVAKAAMKWLWDEERQKFKPHVYVGPVCGPSHGSASYECFPYKGSPFVASAEFDEDDIYYHGGTAVAIEAGLLNLTQIQRALSDMRANVQRAGGK